jgi:hypothetical protein
VNQHRGHVDEFRGHVHVELPYALDVGKVLRRNLPDRDVVDIDVLFANQIEQQVERAFVDFAERDGKRKVVVFMRRRLRW